LYGREGRSPQCRNVRDGMTSTEIDRLAGQRARITRADGSIVVGRVEPDSVTYFSLHGDDITRLLRYQDVVGIEPAEDDTPDTP